MLSNHAPEPSNQKGYKKNMVSPKWLSKSLDLDEYNPNEMLVVSADGSGNFSTINDAINFAPNNSMVRTVIYVKEGVYNENVEVPSYKTNIVMLGDGSDSTVITGNRSVVDGWTTFRSATLGEVFFTLFSWFVFYSLGFFCALLKKNKCSWFIRFYNIKSYLSMN